MRIHATFLAISSLAFLMGGLGTAAFAQTVKAKSAPVSFAADSLKNDEATRTVTASGHVELEQGGRILKADQVVYNVASDTVKATGNVVLMDPSGDVHFADELLLTDEMRDGTIKHLRSTLKDGSRLWAGEGIRKQSGKEPKSTTMKDAAYTPCEPCKKHPEKSPVWQIKAGEVRLEEDEHRIVYHDATFDMWGVPVMYMPYFAHSDGTVKQKSGFMMPSAGYKSSLGFTLSNSYYMAMSPYQDATLGLTAMTKQAPLLFGEYRRRFTDASLTLSGGVTYSDRTDSEAGQDVKKNEKVRGHIFADGLWDINDKWRTGLNIEAASDDQYMRQYDFSDDDVMESQVYVERFSGRNYAVARLLAFQDIRILEERTDQPDVLPEIALGVLGEPGQMLGGRWSADFSTLTLRRGSDGQDMSRAILQTGWERRFVSDIGLLATVDLNLRGDAYYIHDRDVAIPGSGRSGSGSEARSFARAHIVTSYPLVKTMKKAQVVIEPTLALTASPNINSKSSNFPNEDSQDVQLDTSNLFEADRFPGMDRIEDQSRVTYGLRTSVNGYEGSKAEVFLGQSYRFDDEGNPFPEGSGLTHQSSDLVGQISASYKNRFTLDYRFQLDSQTQASRRHEVNGSTDIGKLQLSARYLYAAAIPGTDLNEDREQIQGRVAYYINDSWRVRTSALQDLGDHPGLRKATLGLDFFGQCVNVSGTIERNLTRDSSGESNTEAMLRIGLKNLGEFATSKISLDALGKRDEEKAGDTAE